MRRMIRVATSYSGHRVAEKAAETAAVRALAKAGISQSSDVAIVFATANYRRKYPEMMKKIKQVTGAAHVVGASGFGVITEEIETENEPCVAIMVLASEEIEAASFLVKNLQEGNSHAGETLGGMIAMGGLQPELLLLFPDAFSFQNHLFFDGLENTFGYLPMVGGSAAEDGHAGKSFQMENDTVAFDAVSGLALSGAFRAEIGITQSCQPFGEPFQVTRSDGNMIYEMDGRPAYDIFLESLSQIESSEVGRALGGENPDEVFQKVFLGVPLTSFQTDFSKSRYLIRNIMGVNAKKGILACVSPVEQGEFITFAVRDAERARQDMRRMLEDLHHRLVPGEARFGFYFNCCARGESLYGRSDEDITMIREFFPNVPIIGFFAYGEIAPVDHVNHLHHYSGVLTLVTDKP